MSAFARRMWTLFFFVRCAQGASGPHGSFAKSKANRPAEIVGCVIDLDAALSFIGDAAVSIDATSRKCTKKDSNDKISPLPCATQVLGISDAFLYAATFLAAAAADCGDSATQATVGTAESLAIAASLNNIAKQATAITKDCDRNELRLAQFASAENPGASIAQCVFYGNLATGFLARAALAINEGVQHCQSHVDAKGVERTMCSVSITAVLSSLTFTGSFIALMKDICGLSSSTAICAGEIMQVIAATGTILVESQSLATVFPITGNFLPVIPFLL